MRKISTALVSFGMSGKVFHGPLLHMHEGFEVISILERTKSLSSQMFPKALIVNDFVDLLDQQDLELIIVNTPDYLHYEMVRSALEAGKHVVVEKPFTLKSEQGQELIELAEKKNLILTVFHNRRWDGDYLTIQDLLHKGVLGDIVEFESHFDRFRAFIVPDTWKESEILGSGVLYNLGSHMIDQALVLFGMPNAIFADLNICRKGGKVTDYYHIHMYYQTMKVILKCSYLAHDHRLRYVIHGTEGSFIKYGMDPQEAALNRGEPIDHPEWGLEEASSFGTLSHAEGTQTIPSLRGNYMNFYTNLYETMTSGADLYVQPSDACKVVRIIELAIQSSKEARIIPVESLT